MAEINFDHLKIRQKNGYKLVNFDRMWTKIDTRVLSTTLNNIVVHMRDAKKLLEKVMGSQS